MDGGKLGFQHVGEALYRPSERFRPVQGVLVAVNTPGLFPNQQRPLQCLRIRTRAVGQRSFGGGRCGEDAAGSDGV